MWQCGSGVELLKIFISTPIDCNKTSFSSMKIMHLSQIGLAIFCMTSYISKKFGAAAPPSSPPGSGVPGIFEELVRFIREAGG